jgi:hypothetical protein
MREPVGTLAKLPGTALLNNWEGCAKSHTSPGGPLAYAEKSLGANSMEHVLTGTQLPPRNQPILCPRLSDSEH